VYFVVLFGEVGSLGLTIYNTGNYDIKISSPERAVLEFCYDVPSRESFDELDHIISGLTMLCPRVLQELMEKCCSVRRAGNPVAAYSGLHSHIIEYPQIGRPHYFLRRSFANLIAFSTE